LAAAGEPDIAGKLKKGMDVGGQRFKVHLDGHNQLPYLTGQSERGPRKSFFYFTDDGDLACMRFENWKVVFLEHRAPGTMAVWFEPFTQLRGMKMFDLRADPYERADITSNTYYDWLIDRAFIIYGAQAAVAEFLATFKEFPPSQRAATFGVDQAMEKMKQNLGGH
jgi:arylsulfatase